MNKVLVIGDSCEDRFTYGSSHRLCPDTPAPVFLPNRDEINAGMAGNVYENLKGLGLKCDLITNSEKIIKQRYVDEKTNHTFLRVDTGDTVCRIKFNPSTIQQQNYKAIVIADYGKGFLTESDISILCELNKNVFLDTKKPIGPWCKAASFVKVNSPEFELFKKNINLKDWVGKLIVTLGERGSMFLKNTGFHYYPVEKVDVFDLSGAGDTFHSGVVAKFIETEDIERSIKYANRCASEVVQKKGVVSFVKKHKNDQ
jgi:D-beta-D-heptose 7-phosphate kinase/D-beta-D-heptose 1-phosphate adenosyltransferase